jgi:excisionase family DNA binding protein
MADINQPKDQKEMIRVSISEAARLFGVNAQTIRRAIKSQEVTYVVVAGRYKLNFESLVKWSQRHTTVKNKLQNRGIGQYVDKWKIKNPLYSPNPKSIQKGPLNQPTTPTTPTAPNPNDNTTPRS